METGGNFTLRGSSNEIGRYQFVPSTFSMYSKRYYGEVLQFTELNEESVALLKIQEMIDKGYTDEQVALTWNQGHPGKCGSGVNGYGVKYDSCAYARKVLAKI